MAQLNERKGVFSQIIVAVVIALLAGGTAPWWWSKIFPEKNVTIKDSKSILPQVPRASVQGEQVKIQCNTTPHSISPGGQARIHIFVINEQNTPVSGANVLIESGGGWFSLSGTTSETGQTDSGGVFMTQWKSPNPAARGYVMSVTVTRQGLLESKGECNISIR